MPINPSAVDWLYVVILSALAFVAALLGSLISFRNKFAAAIIAAVLFAAGFIFWTYYPRDNFPDAIKSLPTAPTAPTVLTTPTAPK
jgi:hypothetical protein